MNLSFKICIIIPFYQRERGLLRRAVDSIVTQDYPGYCSIIVVDDGSPVAAESELSTFAGSNENFSVKIITQANTGVGGARNRALIEVDDDTDVVAFLDSDDTFAPGRLKTLEKAFQKGADFFFSDTVRPDAALNSFRANLFFGDGIDTPAERLADELYCYLGSFSDLVLTNCPFGTNSIAYRWKGRAHVRFPIGYKRACEDRVFAARLLSISQTVVFSTAVDVELGVGINIFASSSWGTEKSVVRLLDTARFHSALKTEISLDNAQNKRNDACLKSVDLEFMEANLVVLVKKKKFMPREFIQYLKIRPAFALNAPMMIWRILRNRANNKSSARFLTQSTHPETSSYDEGDA